MPNGWGWILGGGKGLPLPCARSNKKRPATPSRFQAVVSLTYELAE